MEAVRAAWAPALALSGPIATFPAKRHFFQHSLCSRCSTSSLGVELSWHRECARPATQLPRATKGEGWKSAIYTGMWQASMEEDFLVEEAMNPHVVVLPEGSSIRSATHEFITHNISGAPVVGNDGRVKGVLCKSDITIPFSNQNGEVIHINAMHIPFLENQSEEMLKAFNAVLDRPVEDFMHTDPKLATPTMTISRAMSMMVQGHINRLPVVEDGEVVGILTRYDILRALTRLSSLENIDSSMI